MSIVTSIRLTDTTPGHNKEYRVQIVDSGDGTYAVDGFNCAIGGNPIRRPQGSGFSLADAEKAFAAKVNEQTRKGYVPDAAPSGTVATVIKDRTDTGMRAQLLTEISRTEAADLIYDNGWGMQIKEDGERLMIRSLDGVITAANRSGIETNLTDDLTASLAALPGNYVLDGEMVDGTYHVFDLLAIGDISLVDHEYDERDRRLTLFLAEAAPNLRRVRLYRYAYAKFEAFREAERLEREGVVFKRLGAPYRPGRPNSGGDQRKFKFWAELSAIISAVSATKASADLELYDVDGSRVSVGSVKTKERVQIGDIVDIKYLYVKRRGGALCQSEYKRKRSDVQPHECTIAQIKYRGSEALSV